MYDSIGRKYPKQAIYRNQKESNVFQALEGKGEWVVIANGHGVSFWDDEKCAEIR